MENSTNGTAPSGADQVVEKTNRKKYIWLAIILVVAVVAAVLWYLNYNKYITTDDANLDSYRVDVAARVMAPIVAIHAWEGDTVKAGMLLLELDSSSVIAQLKEALAQRDEMVANLRVDQQDLVTAQANLSLSELSMNLAKDNFDRATIQYKGNAIPKEAYQQQQEAYESAVVRRDVSKNQIEMAHARIAATQASIAASEASVESVRNTLSYYKLYAPSAGVIAKRYYLPGDVVQPGQTIYTLNEGSFLWVAIYLEETKFKSIYMGQQVDFTLDAYPDLKFSGKIFYIGTNAASEFALIPPSNASGNYTKVTQRIPMKVSIDEVYRDKDRVEMPVLVSGMSANIKIVKKR